MISMPLVEIEKRAGLWAQALGDIAEVVDGATMVGGGSLPGSTLPTRLVAIGNEQFNRNMVLSLARALRHNVPPVIGRIANDILLLDPRTVMDGEDDIVLQALKAAISGFKR
jgi:L-seryl-tRNA(Ser) seleniumtransferase